MLNQCTFIGNLGADPEIRSFQNGGRVCNLRLAVTDKWKAKDTGEQKENTEWISIVLKSDGLVGVAERFLRKGSKVYVQGSLATRKYQDQSGNDRYTTEVVVGGFDGKLVMLDGAKGAGSDTGAQQQANHQQSGFADDLDSDVPFITANGLF